jgi:hypothetical protein
MTTIKTSDGTELYYKDWGTGQPVVFSHGWPLSADAWEDQMVFLVTGPYSMSGRVVPPRACPHSHPLPRRDPTTGRARPWPLPSPRGTPARSA